MMLMRRIASQAKNKTVNASSTNPDDDYETEKKNQSFKAHIPPSTHEHLPWI